MSKMIKVIDDIMGAGKTSFAIQYMKQTMGNFIYVTPYLKEIDRISQEMDHNFSQPTNVGCGKMSDLKKLILQRKDIGASHELFRHIDSEIEELLQKCHYTLILDEVLSVLDTGVDITPDDVKLLIDSKHIYVDGNKLVHWNGEYVGYNGKFAEIKNEAEKGRMICLDNSFLIWQFPESLFDCFDQVFVLTYDFDASILRYFFDVHGIKYKKFSLEKDGDGVYSLVEYHRRDTSGYKNLIKIYNGNINYNVDGVNEYAFSKSWYRNPSNKELLLQVTKNMKNFFHHHCGAKETDIMWTVHKDFAQKISGKGFAYHSEESGIINKTFLSCNARATNDWISKTSLAYCLNWFLPPVIHKYMALYGVKIDEEANALSQMLQWIWRSGIREGKQIQIYIPSYRMRRLLYQWLGQDITDVEGPKPRKIKKISA